MVAPYRNPEVAQERVERDLDLPVAVEDVWVALTEPGALGAWFGDDIELEPRPGGRVTAADPDGRRRLGLVEEVEPGARLSFRWWPDPRQQPGPRSATRVTFTLEPSDAGTALHVVEEPAGV